MKLLLQNLVRLQSLEFSQAKEKKADAAIAELRGQIPQQILAHYDRLVARGKKGVAAVNNQVCSGCHMRLPLGVVMTLMHSKDIQICDSCGRYLYLPEPSEIPAAPVSEVKPARKPRKKKAAVPV